LVGSEALRAMIKIRPQCHAGVIMIHGTRDFPIRLLLAVSGFPVSASSSPRKVRVLILQPNNGSIGDQTMPGLIQS
jgi:hypothetical protein